MALSRVLGSAVEQQDFPDGLLLAASSIPEDALAAAS